MPLLQISWSCSWHEQTLAFCIWNARGVTKVGGYTQRSKMNGWTIPHRNSNIYCPWNSAFQTVWIKTDLLKCILWCYTNCRKKPQNIPLSESKTDAVHYLLVFCRWKKSLCFLKISSSESVLSAFSLLSMVIPWGTCHSWNFQKDSRELVVEKCCTPQKLQDKFAFKQKWNTGFKKKKKYHGTFYI